MSGRWEQIGAARYFGGAIRIAVGLTEYMITAADAPGLVMEGDDVDVWQVANPPFVAGRAGWSAEGRMMVLSLPKHGLVQIVGGQIVNHYLAKDKRPCAVIAPPVPEPMAREPTRDGMAVRAV